MNATGGVARQLGKALTDLDNARVAIAKSRCERSLIDFVELFWVVIEPLQPFVRGWVQELICKHLEAVTAEQLDKVLINVPPGMSKSTLVNVMWAAWEWGPKRRPDLRYISWSYSGKLTERDNSLCRKIIESPLYQRMWGQCAPCRRRLEGAPRCKTCEREKRFRLDGDQNAKTRYRNDWGGFRFASSVGGAGTGERADRLIFDDPHSVQGAESDVQRQETIDWFAGTLPSRVRNADSAKPGIRLPEWVRRAHGKEEDEDEVGSLKSATVGIMQRVHLHDVSGVILATPELGYVHVCVEMEYEGDKHPARVPDPDTGKALSTPSPIAFEDPRKRRLASVPHDVEPRSEDDSELWWSRFCNVWVRIAIDTAALAFPDRFSRHEIEKLKVSLLLKHGGNAVEAQLQQWPQQVGGEYFPRTVIDADHILDPSMLDTISIKCGYATRGWDLASTDDDPRSAATVGVLGFIDGADRLIIVDMVKTRSGPDGVDELIKDTTETDRDARGFPVRQDFPRDPGQAGKYQVNALTRMLIGHEVDNSPEQKSKKTRAYPLSSQWKVGNVYLIRGAWNAEFLRIMSEFPVGRAKDEVDASTRMFDSQVRAEPVSRPAPPRAISLRRT